MRPAKGHAKVSPTRERFGGLSADAIARALQGKSAWAGRLAARRSSFEIGGTTMAKSGESAIWQIGRM
jgi:hypothetical protein